MGSMGNEIYWTCRYPATLKILGSPLAIADGRFISAVKSSNSRTDLVTAGNLIPAFTINMFYTEQYDVKVSRNAPLFLGSTVFVDIRSTLKIPIVKFVVKDCAVHMEEKEIFIIKSRGLNFYKIFVQIL